ncbi:MAG: MotA/TolQ/ExbB proton channel family protein [Planctomycetota bacterium]
MTTTGRRVLSRMVDLPFAIAMAITVAFYAVVLQKPFHGSVIERYTCEHTVQYVIVGFFVWGVMDAIFRVSRHPREKRALREQWLPRKSTREQATNATALLNHLRAKPEWLQESRMGKRLMNALSYLEEKGSADGFGDFLQSLADRDEDDSHADYALIRFIAWVTPVLGFLGTVLYFGYALGGLSVDEMTEQLPRVVSQMGAAFNTTTLALGASTSMMFLLFICERIERGINYEIDRRTERELLNRFEMADENLIPFLNAVQASSSATLQTMQATVDRQLRMWSEALSSAHKHNEEIQNRQVQVWSDAILRLQKRFEESESLREQRLARVLESFEKERAVFQSQTAMLIENTAKLRADFDRSANTLASIFSDHGKLVELQHLLANNLRVLRETQKIDDAVHGLTAAIHLLTARHASLNTDHRAA